MIGTGSGAEPGQDRESRCGHLIGMAHYHVAHTVVTAQHFTALLTAVAVAVAVAVHVARIVVVVVVLLMMVLVVVVGVRVLVDE